MGLVHGDHGDLLLLHEAQKALVFQPLRGDVQELVHPLPELPAGLPIGCLIQRAVVQGRRDARAVERRHLVFHQGDEGRDDQRQTRQEQRRDLITHGLAAPGGHDAQDVPPG